MIYFKKLRWRNFLSTGNQFLEVDLAKSPSTLIIGTNGAGKSTMLDALCFALFNRAFRDIKKEQLVNTINSNDCEVECEFETANKKYRIVRGIKPNKFEIYCNDVMLNQDASNVDYQNTLEQNILKCNYRAFCQVVILGSTSYEPFMHLRARYRREVVEEILDIRVFSHMDLLLRQKQGELNKSVIDVKHRYDLMTEKYELQKKHFDEIKNRDTTDIENRKQQLKENEQSNYEYNQKLQLLNEKIISTKAEIWGGEKVFKKESELNKLESKIEHKLDREKKDVEFFEQNDNCPTCTQPIDERFRQTQIHEGKKQISKLEEGLQQLTAEMGRTQEQIKQYKAVEKRLNDLDISVAKINTSISEINRHSNRLDTEIAKFENADTNTNVIQKELEQIKEDLKLVNVEKQKAIEEKKYIDIAREILNDTGVKANIIKKYLPIMNNLINKYLQSMDFFVNFHLDEEFNETIKSRFRDTFNYNSFSEGEKLRIDLALLFTWRTIAKMKNSTNTNLLILDEIFDSSLDGQGTEDFFKILKTLTNENTFIISHKGDILFDKFTNIIKFEKYKNFTRLAQ
jgi:DNA repair exonuclease SbcCD ATPase subunit